MQIYKNVAQKLLATLMLMDSYIRSIQSFCKTRFLIFEFNWFALKGFQFSFSKYQEQSASLLIVFKAAKILTAVIQCTNSSKILQLNYL